jgi:hypothetical protein
MAKYDLIYLRGKVKPNSPRPRSRDRLAEIHRSEQPRREESQRPRPRRGLPRGEALSRLDFVLEHSQLFTGRDVQIAMEEVAWSKVHGAEGGAR